MVMDLLLSTGSTHGLITLRKTFKLAAHTGFDGVEYIVNRYSQPRQLEALHEAAEETGLSVRSVHAPFEHVDGWDDRAAALGSTVELARSLGADSVTFHPPQRTMEDVTFLRWISEVTDFQREVGGGDVLVTMENMPKSRSWRGIKVPFSTTPYRFQDRDEMWELMEGHNLYMTFDTTHYGAAGESLGGCFSQFRDRVGLIHLSNFRRRDFQEHLPVHSGDLDLAAFLHLVKRMGYEGAVSLEIKPKALEDHEGGPEGALSEYVEWIRRTLADKEGEETATSADPAEDGQYDSQTGTRPTSLRGLQQDTGFSSSS